MGGKSTLDQLPFHKYALGTVVMEHWVSLVALGLVMLWLLRSC
jgi:hypothetical protein